jgi:hypothetical protein
MSHSAHRGGQIGCRDVASHVQKELDERLRLEAFRRIRAHLEICPNCIAYLDSLKRMVRLYRRAPIPRLGKKARMKLFAAIHLGTRMH